jgi:urocanate reductase
MGNVTGKSALRKGSRRQWDGEWDVIIVGSGFAGLAAALEAHDAGSRVVILEKRRTIGGNSVIAGGMYNAVDPARQRAQGIDDSVDLHYEQTLAGGDFRGEPSKVRYLVEHALDGWQWVEAMGIESSDLFQAYGAMWPRSHRPKYGKLSNGAAIVEALHDQVKARNIPIMREHKVAWIYREEAPGEVLGPAC